MGRKRTWKRKRFSFCFTFLIFLLLSSCAPVKQTWIDLNTYRYTQKTRILLEQGDFKTALKTNEDLLNDVNNKGLTDVALYNLALVYAHHANPDRDNKKSNEYLKRLVTEFPDSPLAEEAELWANVYEVKKISITYYIQKTRKLLRQGDFKTARKENEDILNNVNNKELTDVALYDLALVYAHYANPDRDYRVSSEYLKRLATDFPDSPLAEEAKIWANVFGVMDEITQVTFRKIEKGAYAGLHLDQSLITSGQFEKAKIKNQEILHFANGAPPADAALYNLGLIYAHYANPEKDYKKAAMYFTHLIEGFPQSPLVEEAKAWVGLFDAIEKMRQIDIDIEEKKKELAQ